MMLHCTFAALLLLQAIKSSSGFRASASATVRRLLNVRHDRSEASATDLVLHNSLDDWLNAATSKKEDVRITFSNNLDSVAPAVVAVAKAAIKDNECMCSIPLDLCLNGAMAEDVLNKAYKCKLDRKSLRTGDIGLIAMLLLHERSLADKSKYAAYIRNLSPTVPGVLSWSAAEVQELVKSTTRNVQAQLDAISTDIARITQLSSAGQLPADVFTEASLQWAFGTVKSRYVVVEGKVCVAPALDFIAYDPNADNEPAIGSAGMFGGKLVRIVSDRAYASGALVCMSYGLKSSAECLEDHGLIPDVDEQYCATELAITIDAGDRFYDDKQGVLEDRGLSTTQQFDLESAADEELDQELLRFLRLKLLNGTDSFILESVFRNSVYDTLLLPFSRANELLVCRFLRERCLEVLDKMDSVRTLAADREVVTRGDGVDGGVANVRRSVEWKLSLLRVQVRF